MRDLLMWLAVLAVLAVGAHAGIEYNGDLDAYWVTDYPEEYPCTPALLAQMDALLGLGRMRRDAQTGDWHLTGNLVIGTNDGTDTYFQIGSARAPRETLVVRGNVSVCPYHVQGENAENRWWVARQRINRLTIGDEHDPSIRGALKFDAPDTGPHTILSTGERPEPDGKPTIGRGGQLMVWNGLITAQRQEKGWEIGNLRLRGDGFVFVNSTLSRVKDMMTYGASIGWRKRMRVEDSLFEHGTIAIVGARQHPIRCRFRHCGTAVLDYGTLDVTMAECVFEENRHNWHLRFPGKKTPMLRCVDCVFGPPRQGNIMQYQETAVTRRYRGEGHALHNPRVVSLRHLVVEVRGSNGRPIAGATVAVRAQQAETGIDEGQRYLTGPTGRTPERTGDRTRAILLPEWSHAVPEKNAADSGPLTFSYTITASHEGQRAVLDGVRPDRSWKAVTIELPDRAGQ